MAKTEGNEHPTVKALRLALARFLDQAQAPHLANVVNDARHLVHRMERDCREEIPT